MPIDRKILDVNPEETPELRSYVAMAPTRLLQRVERKRVRERRQKQEVIIEALKLWLEAGV